MREKQKLVGRNACITTDDPQVRGSATLSLNREETSRSGHRRLQSHREGETTVPSRRTGIGFRPSIRRKRYTFQPGDMVVHNRETNRYKRRREEDGHKCKQGKAGKLRQGIEVHSPIPFHADAWDLLWGS
ncbi:MAG: hypothetical protein ACYDAP_14445 [Thermoplasmataceae archaeon]